MVDIRVISASSILQDLLQPQTASFTSEAMTNLHVLKPDPDPVDLMENIRVSGESVLKPTSPCHHSELHENVTNTNSASNDNLLSIIDSNIHDHISVGLVQEVSSTQTESTLANTRQSSNCKIYKCTYPGCARELKSALSLRNHTRIHTGEYPYHCDHATCGRQYRTLSALSRHRKLHLLEDVRRLYRCPYPGCEESIFSKEELRNHMTLHPDGITLVCDAPNCGRSFKSKKNLQRHKVIHMDESVRRRYPCVHPGCGVEFMNSKALSRHSIKHLENKPVFNCNHPGCSRRFASLDSVQHHIKTHGTLFLCPHPGCNRAFRLYRSLHNHMNTHSRAQVFVCDYPGCTRTFLHRASCRNHKRSHIVKREPKYYKCSYPNCDVTFKNKWTVRVHEHRKHGAYPLRCKYPDCSRTFSVLRHLYRHQNVDHIPDTSVVHQNTKAAPCSSFSASVCAIGRSKRGH